MGPPTIVADTNILISALGWNGPERRLYKKCLEGEIELYLSKALVKELIRVLGYPKFRLSQEVKDVFLTDLLTIARLIDPPTTINLIDQDPSDNRVLECAVAANVVAIITGDKHLLALEDYGGIKILRATEFLDRF